MAIDTAAKRKSALGVSAYFVGPVVVPDGSLSQFDRQVIGHGYGGILASESTIVVAGFICVETVSLRKPSAPATLGC